MPSTRATLKVATAPVRHAIGDYQFQLPLLLALLYYPDKLKSIVPARLFPLISSAGFLQGLKVLLGLNITRSLNKTLSRYSANNWKSDAKFVTSQEIILITGGSSGIGELVALSFANKGVTVVSMDVNPPKVPQREPLPS
jgi:all-trans-retinol dehydrogenase (NAD+)